jgi:hypothetical protein
MNGQDIVYRTIVVRGSSEGLDKLQADLVKVAAGHEGVTIAQEETNKSSLTLEQSMAKLERRLVAGARAQQDYEKIQKELNRAVQQNPQLQERANAVLAAAQERYNQVNASTKQMVAGMSAAGDAGAVASHKMVAGLSAVGRAADEAAKATAAAAAAGPSRMITGMSAAGDVNAVASQRMLAGMSSGAKEAAKNVGLARYELINLGRQAQDVGVSLASGQSPLMVLVQQGSQIADVFATSGGTLRGFFAQVIGWGKQFLMSTGGIVTAVLAIGGAAIYAASQFVRASTTVEEALKEQNRLLKEGKALIDERTSAEARAQLQSRDQTELETKRNLIDLEIKLKQAMEETAKLAASRATTPTGGGMPEMGEGPTGFAPLKDPGLDKITDAFLRLNEAREAGLPGLKEFNAELSRIARAHPELEQVAVDLINAGRAGMDLEFATMKARAMSDALKGIATDAQMAAVGLGSLAQFQLNNLQAQEAAAATERMARATMEIVNAYPGITAETAKSLANLTTQMTTQEENNVKVRLEGDYRRINAEYVEEINRLLREGLILTSAVTDAEQNRAAALAAAVQNAIAINSVSAQSAASQQQSAGYQEASAGYLETNYELQQRGVKTQLAATEAVEDTTAADEANTRARRAASDAGERAHAAAIKAVEDRIRAYRSAENAALNEAAAVNAVAAANRRAMMDALAYVPALAAALGGVEQLYQSKQGGYSQFNPAGYESTYDPLNLQGQKAVMEKRARETGGTVEEVTHGLGLGEFTSYRIKQDQAVVDNTNAIKENTAATQTMTDVLSPFYSSDPRRTHLGFRAFADGGIMTAHGELPLKHYQGGGVATSPQVAVYGEGSTPEAYVPVPSGRIPVEIKQPANSNQRPVNVTINVMGNADANTVAALKSTAFQQAQAMRRAMG